MNRTSTTSSGRSGPFSTAFCAPPAGTTSARAIPNWEERADYMPNRCRGRRCPCPSTALSDRDGSGEQGPPQEPIRPPRLREQAKVGTSATAHFISGWLQIPQCCHSSSQFRPPLAGLVTKCRASGAAIHVRRHPCQLSLSSTMTAIS
jgi:hypothetical protein